MAKFYDVNRDCTTNANGEILYRIMTTLVAAGWLVQMSGDGIGAYDATGSTAITGPASGANGMNNSLAWFRIQDPGGVREFIFQRGTGVTTCRIKYSALDKFTGGSPATAVLPTATDEQYLCGAAAPTYATIWGAAASTKAHIIAQSTPEGGVYGWWAFCTTVATGATLGGTLFCEPLASGSYPSADADPCVVATPTGTGSAYVAGSAIISNWYKMNLGGEAFGITSLGIVSFSGGQAGFTTTPYVGANPYDGDANGVPLAYGRLTSETRPGWKGFAKYLKGKGQGNVYPDTLNLATDAYVFVDGTLVPWPESVTPAV